MDGVIVDSNPVHTQAWVSYLDRFGIRIDNLEARMYGRRNDEIVRDFFGEAISDAEVIAHGAEKERLYRELMRPQITDRLVPGVVEIVRSAREMPMGIGTNAEPNNVSFVLEACGLDGYFRAVVDGHQVRHAKPHPEVYLRAAQLLGIEPGNCIVFEDSFAGTASARAAGARVVGVKTSHLEFPDTDFAIHDFRDPELVPWLAAQKPRS